MILVTKICLAIALALIIFGCFLAFIWHDFMTTAAGSFIGILWVTGFIIALGASLVRLFTS